MPLSTRGGNIELGDIEFLLLIITNTCNLRCRFCNLWKEERRNLNKKIIKNLLKEAKEYMGASSIAVSGGEPLTRYKDVLYIMTEAQKLDINEKILVTNGTLLTKEKIFKLYESGLTSIVFSIDGLGEVHNYLRGKSCFTSVINNLKSALKLRDTYKLKYKIIVDMTLNRLNLRNIPDLVNFLNDLGVDSIRVQPIIIRDSVFGLDKNSLPKIRDEFWIKKEDRSLLENVINFLKEFKRETGIISNSDDHLELMDAYFFEQYKLNFKCEVYKHVISVDYNGDIRICTLGKPIGNIHKQSLKYVLKNVRIDLIKNIEYCKNKCLSFCHHYRKFLEEN